MLVSSADTTGNFGTLAPNIAGNSTTQIRLAQYGDGDAGWGVMSGLYYQDITTGTTATLGGTNIFQYTQEGCGVATWSLYDSKKLVRNSAQAVTFTSTTSLTASIACQVGDLIVAGQVSSVTSTSRTHTWSVTTGSVSLSENFDSMIDNVTTDIYFSGASGIVTATSSGNVAVTCTTSGSGLLARALVVAALR